MTFRFRFFFFGFLFSFSPHANDYFSQKKKTVKFNALKMKEKKKKNKKISQN